MNPTIKNDSKKGFHKSMEVKFDGLKFDQKAGDKFMIDNIWYEVRKVEYSLHTQLNLCRIYVFAFQCKQPRQSLGGC